VGPTRGPGLVGEVRRATTRDTRGGPHGTYRPGVGRCPTDRCRNRAHRRPNHRGHNRRSYCCPCLDVRKIQTDSCGACRDGCVARDHPDCCDAGRFGDVSRDVVFDYPSRTTDGSLVPASLGLCGTCFGQYETDCTFLCTDSLMSPPEPPFTQPTPLLRTDRPTASTRVAGVFTSPVRLRGSHWGIHESRSHPGGRATSARNVPNWGTARP
jgi:hypothetical protein